ncbi:chitobiosyldiphosphodolichol beta-mannosyltransferase isoform X2 [Calliopsis andreniformis]|uniref:chitobiosyldiphosphodolichol beta-mannosyltransferase isoform X2 n=1 Tax=Calliopsis andreniformis TaxID=337506 RepID=UPI003FCC9D60
MWIICLLCVFLVTLFICRKLYIKKYKECKNVCVVVLGDLGRSPRMQYHAVSFAKEGFMVDLIGYPGSLPLKEIIDNPRIRIYYLLPPPELENKLSRLVCYAIKTLWQTFNLLLVLFNKRISNIMALNLTKDHLLVKFAKWIEVFFGSKAQSNFCVSKAMKEDLQNKWKIKADVLYDRPPNEFHPIPLAEKHAFLLKLGEKYSSFKGLKENSTIFSECVSNAVQLSPKRPGFIVSSTSWTEDEDFSILLDALQEYENAIVQSCNLPDLICVITGKGPLKEFYMSIIKLKNWKHITIVTPWLESEDYPKMLASADLGICLHTSSSGLDLPMKVVDMFGCELPVCAYDFNCLSELVKHNENGMVFSNVKELTDLLKLWFEDFPNNPSQHKLDERFRAELHKFQENRWHNNWISVALPHFNE